MTKEEATLGIYDFVKSVGKKLGIGSEDTPPSADDLKKELDSHKLGTDKVKVEVKGDTAVIKGEVADQSIFEKAIIAVGNTLGISKVEATEVKVAKADAKAPVFYTVKKGDNLWKIADPSLRQGQGPEIHGDLRGQQADAEGPRSDLSGPGAAHSTAPEPFLPNRTSNRLRRLRVLPPSPSAGRGPCRHARRGHEAVPGRPRR